MSDLLERIWVVTRTVSAPACFSALLDAFSTPSEIYAADEQAYRAAGIASKGLLSALANKSFADAERLLEYCSSDGIRLITYWDSSYPPRLRNIKEPPPCLYVRGVLPELSSQTVISIVGTRDPSDYGLRMTNQIAFDLATAGALVTSGLALGIDSMAAAAALTAGGSTVAILGSGIDIIYPKEHARLYHRIAREGAIISEFTPGTRPERWNFPRRNRIISALSDAVLVTEGGLQSGSLITAEHARQQGRRIYALPGQVDLPNGEGTAKLLRSGAVPITCADDILRDVDSAAPGRVNIFKLLEKGAPSYREVMERFDIKTKSTRYDRGRAESRPSAATESVSMSRRERGDTADFSFLSEQERKVYSLLPESGDAKLPDELVSEGFSAGRVLAALTLLESKQLIESCPGGRYRRKR